jgi:hypothetical protein
MRTAISKAIREQVLTEAGFKCGNPLCTHELTIDIHHIIEVSQHGGNEAANLLPLCPYCHRLYHNDVIPKFAIEEWKKRLVSRNSPLDPVATAKIVAEVNKLAVAKPGGFAQAAAEFTQRTCRIGFEDKGEVIVTGYGCFIDQNLMVTAESVIETTQEVLRRRGDRALVWSSGGLATYEVYSASEITRATVIKVGAFDTTLAERVAKEKNIPFELAFPSPLRTQVRYRSMPAVGEMVGIIHSPTNTSESRSLSVFQFEHFSVAFRQAVQETKQLIDFTLSPLTTRLEYAGSPVFNELGVLVGVVTDVSLYPPEMFPRPVVSGFVKLDPFKLDSEK